MANVEANHFGLLTRDITPGVLEFKDDKVFFCCSELKAEVFYSAVVFFCEGKDAFCR
jgi:hypothetical protein